MFHPYSTHIGLGRDKGGYRETLEGRGRRDGQFYWRTKLRKDLSLFFRGFSSLAIKKAADNSSLAKKWKNP